MSPVSLWPFTLLQLLPLVACWHHLFPEISHCRRQQQQHHHHQHQHAATTADAPVATAIRLSSPVWLHGCLCARDREHPHTVPIFSPGKLIKNLVLVNLSLFISFRRPPCHFPLSETVGRVLNGQTAIQVFFSKIDILSVNNFIINLCYFYFR